MRNKMPRMKRETIKRGLILKASMNESIKSIQRIYPDRNFFDISSIRLTELEECKKDNIRLNNELTKKVDDIEYQKDRVRELNETIEPLIKKLNKLEKEYISLKTKINLIESKTEYCPELEKDINFFDCLRAIEEGYCKKYQECIYQLKLILKISHLSKEQYNKKRELIEIELKGQLKLTEIENIK